MKREKKVVAVEMSQNIVVGKKMKGVDGTPGQTQSSSLPVCLSVSVLRAGFYGEGGEGNEADAETSIRDEFYPCGTSKGNSLTSSCFQRGLFFVI